MISSKDDGSPRAPITQIACMMGWILAVVFLGLALLSNQTWTIWFLHPLNTLDGAPREELISGVTLLRIMLPIAGLGWAAWTLHLQLHRRQCAERAPRKTWWTWRCAMGGALLLIAGTVIRLPLLEDGLWYDEIASFWYYGQFGPGPIIGNMFTPANHSLQTLGSWCSVMISGGSIEPESIRLPALILGLATIWPMSVLARDAFASGPWCLMAIGLLLLCPIVILESTEARGYAFMLFFGTSGSALLVRYLAHGTSALLPFYALVTTLGIWSHLVTVVVPMGHAAFLVGMLILARGNPGARNRACFGLAAVALAALTTITVLSPVIPELMSDSRTFSASRQDQPDLFGREGLNSLLGLGGAWSIVGGLPGVILVCVGCGAAIRDATLRRTLLVTGLPLLIAVILISGLGTWVYARFLVFGLTFTILGLAAGLHLLWSRSRFVGVLATVLLLSGWGSDLLKRYQVPRQPIREIMSMVPDDGSEIGFIGITDLGIILSWYSNDPDRITDLSTNGHMGAPPETMSDIGWIVIAYPSRTIPETDLNALMKDMNSMGPGAHQDLVDGFVVRELKSGWIDDDGSVLLLERTTDGL